MVKYEVDEAFFDNRHYGLTPRDLDSESGIYFKHTYTRGLTKRDDAYYTPADYKEKPEKEAPATKPPSQTVTVTEIANLPLVRVSYKAHIFTTATRTVLTQRFYHPGKAPIDGATYNFPLYAGCSVVSFVCHVGPKKVITGVVQPKEVARATYEKAKSQGHTAGLLEEFTPEIFKTSLGNIPAGANVKVEITYLTELKHDTKVDGIRFTVPTSIAPRYGDPPEGLFGDEYKIRVAKGVSFSISVTMGERIRSIESPSHKVSIQVGTHEAVTKKNPNPASQYDDKKALVTLSQKSMHLSGDFVLLVTTATPRFLCTPTALLEEHPKIPGQKALMVTLVPRPDHPKTSHSQKSEIIFIVDRSGSMEDMIPPLKSAVSVFIKSLPKRCKFNICSFGSEYSFLWEKSQDNTAHSVETALNLVDRFEANMGGTELLQPIRETVDRRSTDMNTEVIVLTDGEIWEEDNALAFIKQAARDSKGKLRFFSIGLGSEVSHSLIEGIARSGGGYSQIVADGSDEQDTGGWEGNVVKMLKATLTEHIDHYSLKIIHDGFHESDEEDSDSEEKHTSSPAAGPSTANAGKSAMAPQAPKKLSLYSTSADLGTAPTSSPSDDEPFAGRPGATADPALLEDRFSHLRRLQSPELLQAPYQIPPLYPQVRTVAYFLISPTGDRSLRNPTSVKLQGTSLDAAREQSIPITRLDKPGLTIHQLAARMALRDLTDGSSWLHSGKHGIGPEDVSFQEYVEREGESLSIKWGLASKWASFVAVEDEFLEKEITEKAATKANAKQRGREGKIDSDSDDSDSDFVSADSWPNAGTPEPSSTITSVTDMPASAFGALPLGKQPPAHIAAPSLLKVPPPVVSSGKIPGPFSVMHVGQDSMSMMLQPRVEVANEAWDHMLINNPIQNRMLSTHSHHSSIRRKRYSYNPTASSETYNIDSEAKRLATASDGECSLGEDVGEESDVVSESSGSIETKPYLNQQEQCYSELPFVALTSVSSSTVSSHQEVPTLIGPEPSQSDTPHQKVVKIIRLQEFIGSFPVTEEMARLIGLEPLDAEGLAMELFPDKVTDASKILAMTALVVAYLELEMYEHEDIWQMIVEKACEFVEEGCERAEALKEKAKGVIQEKVSAVGHSHAPGVVSAAASILTQSRMMMRRSDHK
ncbi:unnamed protein product [Tuber aestivum]|uniref:VWFA domain-containing protein n=1 Tax=Tuber aestivum TaxID=59557 RepID=A0A292Q1W6_9PEZI|nr:unnamed protein product [Tuber aestivum]